MDALLTTMTIAWTLMAVSLGGLAWYASGIEADQILKRVKIRRD
ncbi:MAG: hypothetical protein ACT7A5_05415 [Ferrovibrionaceae bacterium]